MATTAVSGSPNAWTVTLKIPRPPRMRWHGLTVAALILGAAFVVAVVLAGARQTYTPNSPAPAEAVPCQGGGGGATAPTLLPHAAADLAPVCPTAP